MPTWTSREIIAMLKANGWVHTATEGDHCQFKHPSKPGKVTVTHPVKDIPHGTVRSIYRQAGWDWSKRRK